MLVTAIPFAETTEMDAFSDVLGSLQVAGQIVLAETYAVPWGIRIPDGKSLAKRLGADGETKIVPFHIAQRGDFVLTRRDGAVFEVAAGEAIICMDGQSHVMSKGSRAREIAFEDILDGLIDAAAAPEVEGGTSLVCGVFALRRADRNPLIAALPPVLRVGVSGDQIDASLRGIAGLLALEAQQPSHGSAFVASRLVQLFCAEVLRSYVRDHPEGAGSWIKALAHPKIGKILNTLHAKPGAAHTVASMANEVGMSASRFAAVFSEVMGQSPMRYLQSVRMHAATVCLEDRDLPIAEIAENMGYDSVAAFSRAFKSVVGHPPGAIRRSELV